MHWISFQPSCPGPVVVPVFGSYLSPQCVRWWSFHQVWCVLYLNWTWSDSPLRNGTHKHASLKTQWTFPRFWSSQKWKSSLVKILSNEIIFVFPFSPIAQVMVFSRLSIRLKCIERLITAVRRENNVHLPSLQLLYEKHPFSSVSLVFL